MRAVWGLQFVILPSKLRNTYGKQDRRRAWPSIGKCRVGGKNRKTEKLAYTQVTCVSDVLHHIISIGSDEQVADDGSQSEYSFSPVERNKICKNEATR